MRIGDETLTLGLAKAVFSPDGASLAITDLADRWDGNREFFGQSLRVYDIATGLAQFSTRGSLATRDATPVRTAAFSADGSRVATSHVDKAESAGFEPDMFDEMSLSRIIVRDTRTGDELSSHRNTRLCFGPCIHTRRQQNCRIGNDALAGQLNQALKIWDSESGQEVSSIKLASKSSGAPIASPDGKMVAIIQDKMRGASEHLTDDMKLSRIQAIEMGTGRELWFDDNRNQCQVLTFSPDGRWLAGCSRDGKEAVIFDSLSGQVSQRLHLQSSAPESVVSKGFNRLAYSPDGLQLIVASSSNPTVQVWDLQSARLVRLLRGHSSWN